MMAHMQFELNKFQGAYMRLWMSLTDRRDDLLGTLVAHHKQLPAIGSASHLGVLVGPDASEPPAE